MPTRSTAYAFATSAPLVRFGPNRVTALRCYSTPLFRRQREQPQPQWQRQHARPAPVCVLARPLLHGQTHYSNKHGVKTASEKKRWSVALSGSCVHTLHSAATYFGPATLISPMRAELGLTLAQAILPVNVFRAVSCALLIPAGAAMDKFGAHKLLWPAIACAAVLAMLLPFVSNLTHLIVIQVLFALTTLVSGTAAFQVLVMNTFKGAPDAGSAQAVTLAGWSAAGAVAPALIGALAMWFGWRLAFAALASVFLLVGVPLAYKFLRNPPSPQSKNAKMTRSRQNSSLSRFPGLREKPEPLLPMRFLALLGVSGAMSASLHVVLDHLLVFLREDAGFGFSAATRFLSILNIVGLFSKLIAGPLSDRFGHAGLIAGFSCLAMAASLAFAQVIAVGAVSSLATLMYTICYGLGYSACYVLVYTALPEFGMKRTGFRANLNLVVQYGFGALGSLAASSLRVMTGGYAASFYLSAYCWIGVFPFLAAYAAAHNKPLVPSVPAPARAKPFLSASRTLAPEY